MKTTKIYKKNLEKGIITKEMLADCIYSVNKRAIDWSDREQEFGLYSEEGEQCGAMKEDYYLAKNYLLSLMEPTCIHLVKQQCRGIIDFNGWRAPLAMEVPVNQYYLYFDMGTHSFHTPIDENDLDDYPDLEVIKLDELHTQGEDISYLLSDQFVYQVVRLIVSNRYTYVE